MGPIAYLRLNKVEVRVKQVPFEPNFIFAFTGESIVGIMAQVMAGFRSSC